MGPLQFLARKLLVARMVLADLDQQLAEFFCLLERGADVGPPALVIFFGEVRQHGLSTLSALFEGGDVLFEMLDQLFGGSRHSKFSGVLIRPIKTVERSD